MLSYNEGDAVELTFEYTDINGTPTFPLTAEYRIDCETTRKELLGWTTATISTETVGDGSSRYYSDVTIPGTINAIQSDRNRQEVKVVLVTVDRGLSGQRSQTYKYVVKNLQGRS